MNEQRTEPPVLTESEIAWAKLNGEQISSLLDEARREERAACVAYIRRERDKPGTTLDVGQTLDSIAIELEAEEDRSGEAHQETSVNTSNPPSTVSAGRVADGHDQAIALGEGTSNSSDRVSGALSGSLADTSLADRGTSTSAPFGDRRESPSMRDRMRASVLGTIALLRCDPMSCAESALCDICEMLLDLATSLSSSVAESQEKT